MQNKIFHTKSLLILSKSLKRLFRKPLALALSFLMLFGMLDGALRIGASEHNHPALEERDIHASNGINALKPGTSLEATLPFSLAEDDVTIFYVAGTGGTVSIDAESLAPDTGIAQGSTAMANPGYTFINWTDESDYVVGTDQTFVPEKVSGLNVAATYTANFVESGDITIFYLARDGGSVSLMSETIAPATGIAQGSTATANPGYTFLNWTDESDNVVSTDMTFVPEKVSGLNVAATYTANFLEWGYITINYVAEAGGTVSIVSETLAPATGIVQGSTATANPGYTFLNWTDQSDNVVSTDMIFVPEKVGGLNVAATYTANFVEWGNITIHYVAETGGTVSIVSETLAPATGIAQGSTATANPGYTFLNWTDESDNVVSTDMVFVPEKVSGLNVAATYTANFVESGNITIYYVTGTGGTVSRASESLDPVTGIAQGSTAMANAGYRFLNWTDADGNVVSTDATFIPEKVNGLNVSATYTENFEAIVYNITYQGLETGTHTNPPTYTVEYETIMLDGATRQGYIFEGWFDAEEGGNKVTEIPAGSIGDITLWARWRAQGATQQQPSSQPPQGVAPEQPSAITEPPPEHLIPFTDTHYRYLIGDDMNLIRPNDDITRAEAATIFFRLLTDEYREQTWTQANPFPDVALQNWHNNAISVMTSGGTILGMPDGSFEPDRSITRAEFAAITSRFVEHSYDGDDLFSDISGHWAQNYINSVGSLGWVIGSGGDTYEPNRNITRAEAATVVNRILGRHPEHISDLLPEMNVWSDNADQSAWYYLAIQEATNSNNYEMKDDNFHKTWIEMIADPDWAALERPDSTPRAHRNPA